MDLKQLEYFVRVAELGSFTGALGGGLLYDALGSYTLAWQLAVALGLTAGATQGHC